MNQEVMNELVNMSQEIIKLKDAKRELVAALKDAYPYIDNDALRFRIGTVIAKAVGAA